jgi:hypothetical protein
MVKTSRQTLMKLLNNLERNKSVNPIIKSKQIYNKICTMEKKKTKLVIETVLGISSVMETVKETVIEIVTETETFKKIDINDLDIKNPDVFFDDFDDINELDVNELVQTQEQIELQIKTWSMLYCN